MANVPVEAEHESDDDCEVYFLRPVNEYNIIDKIKEANNELFSKEIEMNSELIAEGQQCRKVSFAINLEEYEPLKGISQKELENQLGMESEQTERENLQKIQIEHKLEIIGEEEAFDEIEIKENCRSNSQENENQEELENINGNENLNKSVHNQLESSTIYISENENTILEEICEEILIMDMENDKFEESFLKKSNNTDPMQRKMLKQITFDYTTDDEELDNKSLTNLLISDNEDFPDENTNHQEYLFNFNESLNDDTYTEYYDKEEQEEEEEDDDKLSITVATYLSDDDLTLNNTSLTSSTIKNSRNSSKTHKLLFNKGFSLRHKSKSSNSVTSCSNNHHFMPPPEVTDLKLHYKTCCEFKNEQINLPKYTGYLSEYGLSKEQLIKRERNLQQKEQSKIVKILKTSEAEMCKIHDNERAFTTWLKNKMRYPINKTRNMFDIHRPFSLRKCTSVGGNSLNDDTIKILNTTKYRSVSAKLKKK